MNYEKERKIREITKEVLNNKCIDCNNYKPEYISLNNAIFICKNCYKNNHQKLPMNISRIIKNNLKLLTLKELQYLYFGGNKKMLEFMKYEYPKLIKLSPILVYKTIAMEYYRNWLAYLVEGGNKPIKPDIEIAYNSIENKIYKNNNYLSSNNSDVITIDFINDCYNYNDKYNNNITNFINKKNPKSNRESIRNNNNTINMLKENNRLKYQTNIDNYQKLSSSSNIKDFLNYYKTINKNNYEKYVSCNENENFSKTQNNFSDEKFYINNRRKRISQEKNIDNNFDKLNNDNQYNNHKIIKAFKTNNRIYMKPKQTLIKSFERESTHLNKCQNEINDIKVNEDYNIEKENNTKNNEIQSKKDLLNNNNVNIKEKIEEKKENILNNNDNNIKYKPNLSNKENNSSLKLFNKNKIKEGWARSRYARKKISNNFSDLNKSKDNQKEKNNITQDNNELENEKVNEVLINQDKKSNFNKNNGIFHKKSINNSKFFIKLEKNKNSSQIDHSQFEILSKNVDTTRDDGKSYEESYDDTQNTMQSLPLNKSLRQFYSRYPRKMKRTKTNRRKLNDKSKNKEKKNQFLRLKKEKSEIIQSLKVLLQKKEQIKKEKADEIEEKNNEKYNNYKNIENDKRKKIFVNKIRNEELNNIIINENLRKRKDNNIEENKKNKENLNEEFENRKIYVKQNEDLTLKKDKNSIRSRYKTKNFRLSGEE